MARRSYIIIDTLEKAAGSANQRVTTSQSSESSALSQILRPTVIILIING
jgi:hypothetical protein